MKSLLLVFLLCTFSVYPESYKDLSFDKLHKMAQSDDEVAMSVLAEAYDKGNGVEQDTNQAFKWYKKAAELNYAPAQYNLAVMLSKGLGSKQDLKQAF